MGKYGDEMYLIHVLFIFEFFSFFFFFTQESGKICGGGLLEVSSTANSRSMSFDERDEY